MRHLQILGLMAGLTALVMARGADGRQEANRRPESPVTAKDDRGLARSLQVVATCPKVKYKQLEPIVITIDLKNIDAAKRTLYVPPPPPYNADARGKLGFMDVKVYHEGKRECLMTSAQAVARMGGFGGSGVLRQSIGPGETYTGDLPINLRYDMTRPGSYLVVIESRFCLRDDGGKEEWTTAHSQAVSLEVVEGVDIEKK